MNLATREWLPDPNRLPVALLIHGMGGNGDSWYHLAEHLADLGYRVVAPDLSGHGDSARSEKYSVKGWVAEVLELLEGYPSPQLIVGHSLGGLIATGVAQRLAVPPKRVILIDPAWLIPAGAPAAFIIGRTLARMSSFTAASVHRSKPTWSGKDINIELASVKKWDPKTVSGLHASEAREVLNGYLSAKIPTTLVRPNGSIMVLGVWARMLTRRHGIEIHSLPKSSHTPHRDDPSAFLQVVADHLKPLSTQ
jgi:pimeloyl-ACP methyl ester carboxylesterase